MLAPVPVDDPSGAFASDQLGVMDHLGIGKFFFFGNCIGGPFAMKLMERAPQRVVAAILSQPVGHNPAKPDYITTPARRLGQGTARTAARRLDGDHREVSAQPFPRAARLRVQRVARIREIVPHADAGAARRCRRTSAANLIDIASLCPTPISWCFRGRSRPI